MVDLKSQYLELKNEIDQNILEAVRSSAFINGPFVKSFEQNLAEFLAVETVISCGNGTDALQIALMALDLPREAEVILPSFTYAATAEVIGLLGLTPVMVDVNQTDFNISIEELEKAITPKSKVIVPVHLYGQSADMEALMEIARNHDLYVVEDNAQSIGALYSFSSGKKTALGCIGDIGCTSFYPSKNLGAYGDGGALMTNNPELAKKIRQIANHGQSKKYYHERIGVNSRLDNIQAAVLLAKLSRLSAFNKERSKLADFYDQALKDIDQLIVPKRNPKSTHVFHQYTLRILENKRDNLIEHLNNAGISSMIYYPLPLYAQKAYAHWFKAEKHPNAELLCKEVLSIPMHPNMKKNDAQYIVDQIKNFFS